MGLRSTVIISRLLLNVHEHPGAIDLICLAWRAEQSYAIVEAAALGSANGEGTLCAYSKSQHNQLNWPKMVTFSFKAYFHFAEGKII